MKEVILSMQRTPYQSLTAFLTLFLTLFLSLILFVSLSFLYGILSYIETRPQVTVYFQPKTAEKDIFKVRDKLIASGKILSIKYISQQEAFQIYRELNKDNPLLLEMVSADILPPSLEIFAKQPIFLSQIAEFLKKQPSVDEVQFQKDIVDRLLNLTTVLRKATFIFFVFLLLVSIIVLTTNTLFKIALKKEEIELLRLLGATKSYIIRPFILESFLLGFTASTVAFVIFYGLFLYFNPFLKSYLSGVDKLTINFQSLSIEVWPLNSLFLAIIYLFCTFFGISIATIASLLATNKHLKE